jgi:hypothetical protein
VADIGSLIVKIGADASGLQKAFTDLGGSAGKFRQGLGNLAKIGGAAFVAVAASMTAMTIAAGQQAEALTQLSSITGINTDTLQEYDVLLGRVGLDSDSLVVVFRTLSKNMEEAQNGVGNAADRFRQLGIDVRKVTSTDDLLRKVATAMSGMASGAEKAAIAGDLMGRSGLKFIPAFEGGARAIDEAAAASARLGAVLSSGQLAELGTMDDVIDDLTVAWKRFGQQLASFVAPAVEFVANAITRLLALASNGLAGLNALAGTTAQADTRAKPAPLVDTAKRAAQSQSLLDTQLRVSDQAFADAKTRADADTANYKAQIEEKKVTGILSAHESAMVQQEIIASLSKFELENLRTQLDGYKAFAKAKDATFTRDEKGRVDRLKFMEEAGAKERSMINQIQVAQVNADTARIQSGLAVRTFWQQQLQDLVASNAFSVSQIVTTWTSGVANAVVTGGDFVKAAWQSTQVAVVQGALNTGVQLAAQWALQSSLELGILSATEAAKLGLKTASNATILAGEAATAGGSVAIWAGATTAIAGLFGTFTAALSAMFATMVGVMTAVGTFVMGVLSAIAEALADTVFGIPWAIAILAGIVLIAAALAATGNLGFKEGGIGDFGSGTQATLHGPEAIIPLNSRGANFMREAFGSGGSGQIIHTHVMLNGREIAMAVSDEQFSSLRSMGVL